MKRIVDFGDKNYINCKTDKNGLFIRLWPGAWKDLMLPGKYDNMPENATIVEHFEVNKNISGCFYLLK